jgi:hypothetical protein
VDDMSERRRAHGPRLALSMADFEANFGEFDRALYWSAVAEAGLGRLPRHYQPRREMWHRASGGAAGSD